MLNWSFDIRSRWSHEIYIQESCKVASKSWRTKFDYSAARSIIYMISWGRLALRPRNWCPQYLLLSCCSLHCSHFGCRTAIDFFNETGKARSVFRPIVSSLNAFTLPLPQISNIYLRPLESPPSLIQSTMLSPLVQLRPPAWDHSLLMVLMTVRIWFSYWTISWFVSFQWKKATPLHQKGRAIICL